MKTSLFWGLAILFILVGVPLINGVTSWAFLKIMGFFGWSPEVEEDKSAKKESLDFEAPPDAAFQHDPTQPRYVSELPMDAKVGRDFDVLDLDGDGIPDYLELEPSPSH